MAILCEPDIFVTRIGERAMVNDDIVGTPDRQAVNLRMPLPYVGANHVMRVLNIERIACEGNPRARGRRSIDGDEGLPLEFEGTLQLNSAADAKDDTLGSVSLFQGFAQRSRSGIFQRCDFDNLPLISDLCRSTETFIRIRKGGRSQPLEQ